VPAESTCGVQKSRLNFNVIINSRRMIKSRRKQIKPTTHLLQSQLTFNCYRNSHVVFIYDQTFLLLIISLHFSGLLVAISDKDEAEKL